MIRNCFTVVALAALGTALPTAQEDFSLAPAEELAADVESSTRYAAASGAGDVVVFDDPDIVSAAWAGDADPLECTALEGASALEQDAAADERPFETTSAWDIASLLSETSTVLDPSATADAITTSDAFTAVKHPVS